MLRRLTAMCFTFLVLSANFAFALTTRYIGPTRTPPDFADIASACTWLNNNHPITDDYQFLIDPGTYAQGICELKVDQGTHRITFSPAWPGAVVHVTSPTQPVWRIVSMDNVKIDSLYIESSYMAGDLTLVSVSNATGCRLLGDVITGPLTDKRCFAVRIGDDHTDYDSVVNCRDLARQLP